VRFKLSSWP